MVVSAVKHDEVQAPAVIMSRPSFREYSAGLTKEDRHRYLGRITELGKILQEIRDRREGAA